MNAHDQEEVPTSLAFPTEAHFTAGFSATGDFGGEGLAALLAEGAGGAVVGFF